MEMVRLLWVLWIRNKNGEFERISHGGKVLMNTTAMTAEREALRMGVEYLATLFPVDAKECTFVVENESTETKYIVDAQSMRLFGLCNDHAMCSDRAEDVHRADANRLCQKKITRRHRQRERRERRQREKRR